MKNLNKDVLENMSYKDITNLLLEDTKGGLNTLELFTKIVELLGLPKSAIDNKIADYYTSLTTDKRFVLIDGKWDLRSRHPSDKVIVKVDDEDEEETDNYDDEDNIDEDYDDDDDLSDLVVLDEDELEQEQ